ncbi:carotenoid 1,2-hydratase [Albimonas sp. CAU 1670]|uniref:carotenoid 1,2-hydratase n=1 Tax=Albimonas sp. CAU 1670 TaxID=3032599 RepID=UPI0023DCC1FA|nr:carotenoid 1,2-hydratase [Albimonas sp. CAU 1670]MDF2231485.1 carotenoid 1,2-hydratase [Albimonas sp. CAU 1670]
MIFFIGSVFSPWYAWAGRRDPLDHCCVNVLLSGPGGRWTMTERGAGEVERGARRLRIGRSSLEWDGETLTARLDERAFPHLDRVRGEIAIRPAALSEVEVRLDPEGRHLWRPYAPRAQARVAFPRRGYDWSGEGYFDANAGSRPLEADFRRWHWSCLHGPDRSTCLYEVERRDGGALSLALGFDDQGRASRQAPPPQAPLPKGFWRVARETRADAGAPPRTLRTLLDAPFYVRSAIRTRIDGQEGLAMHESLDLDRFAHPLVKAALAFRIPRRQGRPAAAKTAVSDGPAPRR